MSSLSVATRAGKKVTLDDGAVETFRAGLRGDLVLEGDPGYDDVRALWNAMIDRRPAAIVRCAGAADVIHSLALAREHDLLFSVRGAGHNIAGKASCDGGLMIDQSGLRDVRVDPAARTVRVGPGATLGDVDHETQAFGLAVPAGINSTTGIAGLALGGGFGWISRKHGLTCDNLLSADVVTADGKLVRTSAKEEPDLFWGLQGGGGNLGIVTSFEFRAHPVGPEILAGLVVHPFDAAADVMRQWRDFCGKAPDEATCWVVTRKAPPLPFLPEEWHGREVLILPMVYAGDMAAGEKAFQSLRAVGKPIADVVSPHRFTEWQTAFDPLLTPGLRNYWKSHNFAGMSDEAIDTLLGYAGKLPSPHCEIFMGQLGGATSRIAGDATAYAQRDAQFIMNVHARWEEAQDDGACVAWARKLFDDMAPHATGGVYVNFVSEDEDRVQAAYGGNYERLAKLKRRFDPENLFRVNQNVTPAAPA
jgi:FAD/FMN-containing dehydrogenase